MLSPEVAFNFIYTYLINTMSYILYLCNCAWPVGDLDVRAYLQDKVVSRVPCNRKGMCMQVLDSKLSLYIYSLEHD